MKLTIIFFTSCTLLFSCNQADKNKAEQQGTSTQANTKPEKVSFFPVTDFILGQIAEIKKEGVNPFKKIIEGKKHDSAWLKIESLDKEFAPFLTPVIDSTNLAGIFTESSFNDQTIDAFTFTYDPAKPLPDSFLLQHWDVYVDPATSKVRRIYILKKTADHKILQLTWQANKSCKIITISKDPNGNDHVEKEINIKWDF